MKFIIISYYLFLFLLRSREFYLDYVLALYLLWAGAIVISLWIKEPTLFLVSALSLAFLENAAVFDFSISIPFFVIGLCLLIIHFRDLKSVNLIFCVSTLILLSFYPISFAKDFIVFSFILLLSTASGHTFCKYFKNRVLNFTYIKLVSSLIFTFWVLEYVLVFTLPHLRYNVVYSFDFRPIGFFTETTWFTSLIAFLFLSKLMPSRIHLLGMFVPILGLSRAYLLTVIFYLKFRSLLLVIPALVSVLLLVDADIFYRLRDFTDVSRHERLLDAEVSLMPNMSLSSKASGIFLLQLISVYGIALTVIYLSILIYSVIRVRNWLPVLFGIISFVHPVHFSVVFLLSLTVPTVIKYRNR
jgi:hypothetical protein